jgi:hypothetical protein
MTIPHTIISGDVSDWFGKSRSTFRTAEGLPVTSTFPTGNIIAESTAQGNLPCPRCPNGFLQQRKRGRGSSAVPRQA